MNHRPISYSFGRIVPGILELDAALPLAGILAAARLSDSTARLCEQHRFDTSGPTSTSLLPLVEAVPQFAAAV
jgi:hypothetical protein